MTEIPAYLQPLVDFANTIDVEAQHDDFQKDDDFEAIETMRAWLAGHQLLTPEDGVDAAGYELVRSLRDVLRALFMANHDGTPSPEAIAQFNELAAGVAVTVRITGDGSSLEPAVSGAPSAAARLVALVHTAVAEGSWPRLKLCRADTCQWAYFDASKNRSRNWCSMGVCGNRAKVRAYQARRRTRNTGES